MPKNIITVFVILAFVVSFGIGYSFGNKNISLDNRHTMEVNEVHEISDMSHMMDDMTNGLSGKSGDEFDKAFIEEMIIHHQGAVDMANLALKNAKHKEILDLSKAIIQAQNKEITDMKSWQKAWFNNN